MTPIKAVIVCGLIILLPFALSIVITLATSGEDEIEHARSSGDRITSPACRQCQSLAAQIEAELIATPLPPISSESTKSKASARKPPSGDADSIDDLSETPQRGISEKLSPERQERANQILQSVCPETHFCQRILKRQRREILRYIFNISEDASLQAICEPFCDSWYTVFDYIGQRALRVAGDPFLRRVLHSVGELWGEVLLLSIVGALLGMILHVRVAASRLRVAHPRPSSNSAKPSTSKPSRTQR